MPEHPHRSEPALAPQAGGASRRLRVLVVSNMLPGSAHPERGSFVRDQVSALRALDSLEVELFEFSPGISALIAAARELRRRYRGQRFDVVHAHFGLSAYPAFAVRARVRGITLHGTDLTHPRTRLLTRAVLPPMDLVAAVSEPLMAQIPGRRSRARAQVLPCGVDMERFTPLPRTHARGALQLPGGRPHLLFPADPTRPEKRHDRARQLAQAVGAQLLTLGGVDPQRVPLYVNAADAVIIPSEREGFGLAALEALACGVPVLATPVGVHPQALAGLPGCLCAPFELERWKAALQPHLLGADGTPHDTEDAHRAGQAPVVETSGAARPGAEPGAQRRARAELFSAPRMAQALAEAWGSLIATAG